LSDNNRPATGRLRVFLGGFVVTLGWPATILAGRIMHFVGLEGKHRRGGHFPAVAEPELLARSLRDAFRPMRFRA
jgi:hypothetical protein